MKRYLPILAYLIILSLVLTSAGLVVGAWAFRHVSAGGTRLPDPLGVLVMDIAEVPTIVKTAITRLLVTDVHPLFIDESARGETVTNLQRFPEPTDPGYLLLSGLDDKTMTSTVRLLRISNAEEVLRWDPGWKTIDQSTQESKFAPKGDLRALHAGHPILMNDGSIIFNTGSVLVKQTRCLTKPAWLLNGVFHHSNELADDGTIWTPSVSTDSLPTYEHPVLRSKFRDDALANISPEGKLITRISFASVLKANNLEHLLFGFSGSTFQEDPIHLNQISPALMDGVFWKKGDLLISARHLSTIFLYRPSTNKITWYKTGPWMNQHAAKFVDDRRISIFDNNVFALGFMNNSATNRVFLFDFNSNELSQPFAAALQSARVRTVTAGMAQITSDNRLFVEETNYGRHLMLSENSILWLRRNEIGRNKELGAVFLSRYIEADAGKRFEELAKIPCDRSTDTTKVK
jgi:hypothetical protein